MPKLCKTTAIMLAAVIVMMLWLTEVEAVFVRKSYLPYDSDDAVETTRNPGEANFFYQIDHNVYGSTDGCAADMNNFFVTVTPVSLTSGNNLYFLKAGFPQTVSAS